MLRLGATVVTPVVSVGRREGSLIYSEVFLGVRTNGRFAPSIVAVASIVRVP